MFATLFNYTFTFYLRNILKMPEFRIWNNCCENVRRRLKYLRTIRNIFYVFCILDGILENLMRFRNELKVKLTNDL
jgi:hypothetical protein